MNDIHQITDRERELMAQLEKKSSAIQKLWADRDALDAENEWLLAANRDCIDWFDALKTDYDTLWEVAKLALEALEMAENYVLSEPILMQEYHFRHPTRMKIEHKWMSDKDKLRKAANKIREALAEQPVQQEPCYCDKTGIGEPGVSCGDCPTLDYKQPAQQQEPVALDVIYAAWHSAGVDIAGGNWGRFVSMLPKLYTSPPHRKPLTDEQITTIEQSIWNPEFFDEVEIKANREFARAIEAAHGIKE